MKTGNVPATAQIEEEKSETFFEFLYWVCEAIQASLQKSEKLVNFSVRLGHSGLCEPLGDP